jgi:hypothetical protein
MLGAGAAESKTDFRLLKSYISKKLFFLALPYFFLVADRQMSSMGKTPFGLIFSRLLKFSVICSYVPMYVLHGVLTSRPQLKQIVLGVLIFRKSSLGVLKID